MEKIFNLDMEKICIIDGKVNMLDDVEKLGFDEFSLCSHINPYKSLFRYYPNTTKYIDELQGYINYSFEALKNNTIFLQDAKNFDDCFDCAVDLDYEKFLFNRLCKYCDYFKIQTNQKKEINKLIYDLSCKFYEWRTIEKTLNDIEHYDGEVRNLYIEVFIRKVFINVIEKQDWNIAILNAIKEEYDDFCKVLSKFKICCFSTSPYLNRMWSSAYANNNQGFCVEYEIDLNNPEYLTIYNNIFPVIYSQKRNDYLPLSLKIDSVITKEEMWQMYFNGLLRKSIYWVDQFEWRLIMPVSFIKKNPMPFFKIKKVYLGNKMVKQERMKIIEFCKANSIAYVGIIREQDSFNLIECEGNCSSCKNNY